ncbi:MAG: PqiC family protein [Verrucomicrobiota bacterium]
MIRSSTVSLLTILLVSCGAYPTYYMLSPEGPAPNTRGTGIGVGPTHIPVYLDRANLVFKESENRFVIAESHLWAGDLEGNITSVLATNLGRRKNTGNVRSYPWSDDGGLRYQVSVDIRQFHGTPEGDAFIEAAWRVYSLPDRRMIASKSWTGTEPMQSDGYESLVAAQSTLLARLATEIADSL